jgi:hypothetical protein
VTSVRQGGAGFLKQPQKLSAMTASAKCVHVLERQSTRLFRDHPNRKNAGNGLGQNDLSHKKCGSDGISIIWMLWSINNCARWIAIHRCPARPNSSAPFHSPSRVVFSWVEA